MSQTAISNALEAKLAAMTPAIATAWENVEFSPTGGVEYQKVDILFAEPENPTYGNDFYRQRGLMQVQLRYPINVGRASALARAEAIANWFARGVSLFDSGVITTIEKTPEVSKGGNIDDRYVINVRIRFYANLLVNEPEQQVSSEGVFVQDTQPPMIAGQPWIWWKTINGDISDYFIFDGVI